MTDQETFETLLERAKAALARAARAIEAAEAAVALAVAESDKEQPQ